MCIVQSIRYIVNPEKSVAAIRKRLAKTKWVLLMPYVEMADKDWYARYLRAMGILMLIFISAWFCVFFYVVSK